ncbi:MAG: helix-turn-helix transcriptional regulator [Spirochaetales bacterium]|nr:helix-turn-helix transcriptional regulator [Spirochaetales bacterium]
MAFLPLGLLFIPLFLLIPLFQDINHLEFFIFPTGQQVADIDPVTDADVWKGNSTIDEYRVTGNQIKMVYTLRESEYEFPNVFLIFWLDNISEYCDLSSYQYLDLKLSEMPVNQRMNIFIKCFQQGISSPGRENAESLRHLEKSFVLSHLNTSYRFRIDEFETPEWWYTRYSGALPYVGRESLKMVKSIDMVMIHTSSNALVEEPRSIIFDEIKLSRSIKVESYIIIVFLVLFYGFSLPLYVLYLRKKSVKKLKPQHVDYVNHRDAEMNRIKQYIQANYHDSNISTKKMQDFLGIPSSRIFNLIKEKYDCSFKQLIHDIRIEESKRLILESDLRITEISYKVGFNDTSYFNKVFKKSVGLSPSEYRDKKSS